MSSVKRYQQIVAIWASASVWLATATALAQPGAPHALLNDSAMYRQSVYYAVQKADASLNAEKYDEAIQILNKGVEHDPTQLIAQYNLAFAYMQAGNVATDEATKQADYEKAEWNFNGVTMLNPELTLTWFKLGKLALLRNDPKDAKAYYLAGLENNPTNATLWFNLGTVSERLNDFEGAKKAYLNAIAANPKLVYAENNLGLLYEQFHDQASAEASYREALKEDPSYTFARLNLASLLENQGRLDEALGLYQEVTKIEPKNAWAYLYAGNIYYHQGQYQEALNCYNKMLVLQPNYSPTYYLISLALEKLNRPEEALKKGEQYVHLDPKGQFSQEAGELIMTLKGQQTEK